MKVFLDTSILVYALSSDLKRHRAQEVLAAGGTVSIQVLNELVHVLRRKLERDWADIEVALDDLGALLKPPVPLTFGIHQSARWLARDHGFAFYDALIIAAALEAGCDTLLTEEMQHGRRVMGLTISNPFA